MDDEEDEDNWADLSDPDVRVDCRHLDDDGVRDAFAAAAAGDMRTAARPKAGLRGGAAFAPWRAPPRNHRRLFSLILFALVCSPWGWPCRATHAKALAANPTPPSARFNGVAASAAVEAAYRGADGRRRIRHDTVKNAASDKRLITFEAPASDSAPAFDDDDDEEDAFEAKSEPRNASAANVARRTAERAPEVGPRPAQKRGGPPANDTESAATSGGGGRNVEACSCQTRMPKISRASHGLTTIRLHHEMLNASEGIVPGIVYQVIVKSSKKIRQIFIASQDVDGLPVGIFIPSHKPCSNRKLNDFHILLNWSLPTKHKTPALSEVIFGLCYEIAEHNHTAYVAMFHFPVLKGCEFRVWPEKGSISSKDLFAGDESYFFNCSLTFSSVRTVGHDSRQRGLIIKLTRLNIRCDRGNITFAHNSSALLCGKLEEIAATDREYYFPPTEQQSQPLMRVVGQPVFALAYEQVDYCYNVTLTARNDSVIMNPLLKIFCNYQISLPYGYRIDVTLTVQSNLWRGSKAASAVSTTMTPKTTNSTTMTLSSVEKYFIAILTTDADTQCEGIFLRYWDGNKSKVFCEEVDSAAAPSSEAAARPSESSDTAAVPILPETVSPSASPEGADGVISASPKTYHFQFRTDTNQIRFRIAWRAAGRENTAAFFLRYEAVEVPEIVNGCPFGSVSVNSFCVNLVDWLKLNWSAAEDECLRKGGHLASILDEQSQSVIDEYLLRSPSYQDYNSYWIGASDIGHEGEFRWTNSFPFSYTNWFVGWPMNRYYNRQPNDDGFSGQDCVELRRQYHISPTSINTNGSKIRLAPSFTWNDRDCRTENYFLCEFIKIPTDSEDGPHHVLKQECNQKIMLNENNDRVVISSPDFPHNYPINKFCQINMTAPSSYKIVIVFEEFVLEDEPNYDYLEIFDDSTERLNETENIRRFCGDWSDKLKLLRYVSPGPRLYLRFISDYSHSFSGFKAHVSIEQVKTECSDNRLQMFNGSCYLFVSYPQVTWQTAQDICNGVQGNLASVHSLEEEHFVVAKIRESHEYTTSTIYWLGGKFSIYDEWKWVDNTSIVFNAWVPMKINLKQSKTNKSDVCLGIQWIPSPSSLLPSGLYWVPLSCQKIGGYVCKIPNRSTEKKVNLNSTVTGTEGELISPNFPGNYYHNLDYWIHIIGPDSTRVIIKFHAFDLEEQKNCLYDYLEIYNVSTDNHKQESMKHCGHHHSNTLHRLNYVSSRNEALLRFHSDYSMTGSGFSASWKAVDISGCPVQTLTAKEGIVTSPNYPHFLLARLQCTTTILAPVGRQVWFDIMDWDFDRKQNLKDNTIPDSDLYLALSSKEKLYPFLDANVLTDGVYLSYGQFMRIHLKTGDAPNGRGFKGTYKTISELSETRVITLGNNSIGNLYHLNFPLKPVAGLKFVQRFVAPPGYTIHIQFHHVVPSSLGVKGRTVCQEDETKGFIEVRDHYADRNGTWWQFCEADRQEISQLTITSYLNSLTIKQISENSKDGVLLNASLSVVPDPNFKTKILQFSDNYIVESCVPNPCYNNGKCISDELTKRCECTNHFTGLFCSLTICDRDPCVFGVCELTDDYFQCICQLGYQGKLCDKKVKPCSTNPCEGRGECIEKNNFTFFCQCHAWWEGERCDKKITNIPYKPLTDRMLEEPFWLGLLTVLIVLGIIGMVWCARRHFPEKLEKLLAEEAERNRHYTSSGRGGTSRGDLVGQNGIATTVNASQTNTANSSPNPRTLLGRLGIRKPSLFSLTSPLQPTHTARTFSLDDLFKPSSSRSQMSYKHRNGGGHRKKSVSKGLLKKQGSSVEEAKTDEDKKIETIELKESATEKENPKVTHEETSFVFPKIDKKPDKKDESNYKYEKKVHFAQLMSKVHAEISSSSDVELGSFKGKDNEQQITNEKPLAASTQTLIYQPKSPHSTSSNQGSDSLSSSEMTLISASGEKLNNRRPSLLTLGTNGRCQKAASADSILAMFRKFSLSAGQSSECNSNFVSASTSPTISSPQDEVAGSDDSSLSSYHMTGISSSILIESPPTSSKQHQSTIQVSVLDPMSSQKSSTNVASSNLLHPPTILLEVPNKCLSPIHEVPTPSPSPSMTPIMPRHHVPSSHNNNTGTSSSQDSLDVKSGSSVQVPIIRPIPRLASDLPIRPMAPEISITAPQEDSNSSDDKTTPLPEIIIPTFTIQEPSPTIEAPAIVLCPGTPPVERGPLFPSGKVYEAPSPFGSDVCSPPTITVTCTGEVDSDTDCSSHNRGGPNAANAMTYLSPFSMCSRADRTASESNLSSSGYSSMTSPGPSRCGSSNPLCPFEGDDQCGPSHHSPRKPSPLLRTPSTMDKSDCNAAGGGQPSDSETLSDDHQIESNDEGFSTDQLAEKIKQGEVKSAKELELFIGSEQEKKAHCWPKGGAGSSDYDCESDLNFLITSPARAKLKYLAGSEQNLDHQQHTKRQATLAATRKQSSSAEVIPLGKGGPSGDKSCKSSLQLPSIVVDPDGCLGETRSPVSSRSESPLSDRTAGVGRFSPMFYGRLTDSDGIYDWTSSDCLRPIHRKHFGRRKERHRSKSPLVKKSSPPLLLDVPCKIVPDKCRKPSPKRRVRSHQLIKATSSSSSSESTYTRSRVSPRRLQSPRKLRYSSKSSSYSTTEEISGDDGAAMHSVRGSKFRDSSKEKLTEKENYDVRISPNPRLRFLGKLSSILSIEKPNLRRKPDYQDSASIPLLLHSKSVDENLIDADEVISRREHQSRRFHPKRGNFHFKSSGLTD